MDKNLNRLTEKTKFLLFDLQTRMYRKKTKKSIVTKFENFFQMMIELILPACFLLIRSFQIHILPTNFRYSGLDGR